VTWIRRAFSPFDGFLLRFCLPAALILTITLLIRHGDGSIPWDDLATTFGRAPRAIYIISGTLLCLILAGLFAPRAIVTVISLLLPVALLGAALVNASSFEFANEQDLYHLELRRNPTMLDLAENSPSEFEHSELALYLFMHAEYEGKSIIAYAPELLAQHYLNHVVRVASYRVEEYPHDLDASSAAQLEARPHVERRDGSGRKFIFLTDDVARSAGSFRLMKGPDKFYVLPVAQREKN
jgi:hypothetical protein